MGTIVRFLIEIAAILLIYYVFNDNIDHKIHSKAWWKQLGLIALAITIIRINYGNSLT